MQRYSDYDRAIMVSSSRPFEEEEQQQHIHLLKTFINAANYTEQVLMYQTIIHIVFLMSAMAIARSEERRVGKEC